MAKQTEEQQKKEFEAYKKYQKEQIKILVAPVRFSLTINPL